MTRRWTTLLCFFALAVPVVAESPDDTAHLSVMTQNMDAGTDLKFVIGELLGYFPPRVGVELTFGEILSAGIPQRAELLARAVAARKPELLALQEATLWRTGATVETATTVVFDQLQLLLTDLAAAGVPYDIVAVNTLTDVALPKLSGGAVRFTDRDVLLVRADLNRPAFYLSNVQANLYSAPYSIGAIPVERGYISAVVHRHNRQFRLFATHLQGPEAADPRAALVQAAETTELIGQMQRSDQPVVLAGDFNSDAIYGTNGPGPDNSATVSMIEGAGYADTWAEEGAGQGPTWPFYLEDNYPPPFDKPAAPFERIDLIFASQGMRVASVEHVVVPGSGSGEPLYASDHAGVLAVFELTEGSK